MKPQGELRFGPKFSSVRLVWLLGSLAGSLMFAAVGCDLPDPKANTSTTGRLVLFTDEIYAPLLTALADTFMRQRPDAHVEVRRGSAREMVQKFLDFQFIDSTSRDTGAVAALIIGRQFLSDEETKVSEGKFDKKEYPLGFDGIAVAIPVASPMKYTMVDGLRRSLQRLNPAGGMLDSTGSSGQANRFLLPDQNSSTYQVVRRLLLGDKDIVAPARYFSSSDSVVDRVAAGDGIGIVSWYASRRDTQRVRTLAVGFIDSAGLLHNPVYVHPTSLVRDAYILKQPLTGYTFALDRSLAVGFLAWMARSNDAQNYLAFKGGLQPVIRMRLILPEPQ
jgi:hypothetical protein